MRSVANGIALLLSGIAFVMYFTGYTSAGWALLLGTFAVMKLKGWTRGWPWPVQFLGRWFP